MGITEAQREQRRNHLGSSDMAAILGLDPYRTAYDVWLDKTGQLEDEPENKAMYAGTAFEDGVLKFAEGQLGKIKRNQYRSAKDLPIGANIDALVVETGEPVEAKTAGLFGPLDVLWGEEGTDEVPDRTIIQCHVHMICTNKSICHVPAFLGGRGFQLFQVNQDQKIKDIIISKALDFWNNFVKTETAPPNITPSLGVIKRVKREPESVVDIDDEPVKKWQDVCERFSEIKKAKEAAQANLIKALGTAEAGNCTLGQITYLETFRKGFTVKPSKFRKIGFRKNK